MAAASWLKYARLAFFAKPTFERQLYRLVKLHRIRRIVELGVGRLERTESLISVAQRYSEGGKVSYSGIDWFDARPTSLPRLTLKQAHAALQASGAQVRLVPGEPGRSLAKVANAHANTGLLLISASVDDSSLLPAWFYLPRMLDANSVVLRERLDAAGETALEWLSRDEIVTRAGQTAGRRAA